MMKYIEKLKLLSEKYNEVVLYPNVNTKVLYSGIGRVPATFDRELLKFLNITNGASILDYCFLGFKNKQLGIDIDKFVLELWGSNDSLAGKVIGFMINSIGDTFGYLIDVKYENLTFKNPIVYNSVQAPDELYIISTSFDKFIYTFLNDVEQTILNSSENILMEIELPNWPIDIKHWKENDLELSNLHSEMGIGTDGLLKML